MAATGSRSTGFSRHVVGYLRDFLFRDEQARQPVKALSGGERNRLLLAKILAQPANLLILDEPTNDLDIETLDLLEEMLADYPGTLLLVSHDRDFLDRLVTSTIVFEGAGRCARVCRRLQRLAAPAAGTAERAGTVAAPGQGSGAGPRARVPRQAAARAGPPARPHRRARGRDRHAGGSLADPGLYARDPNAFARATDELAAQRATLTALEERWLELEAQREAEAG